jgi:predicted DNA-binding protein YlxM (UPF0122 family)
MESKADQLTKDFVEFRDLVTQLRNQMDKIKSYLEYDRFDITEVAKKTGHIRYLRQAAKEFIDFVEFPEKIRDPGRPVKFPDSPEEKELLNRYVKEGLSIRKIAEKTGLSKDVVEVKLKRYRIK